MKIADPLIERVPDAIERGIPLAQFRELCVAEVPFVQQDCGPHQPLGLASPGSGLVFGVQAE